MKKFPEMKLVPDEMRERLDFLGYIYCPAKEVFSDKIKKFIESKEDGNRYKSSSSNGELWKG